MMASLAGATEARGRGKKGIAMVFWRDARSKALDARIAQLTAGMTPMPLERAALARALCPACQGHGVRGGSECRTCRGAGAVPIHPEDPGSCADVVHGPCGLGYQRLVPVTLEDGRRGYVHVRQCGLCQACLYVRPEPAAAPAGAARTSPELTAQPAGSAQTAPEPASVP